MNEFAKRLLNDLTEALRFNSQFWQDMKHLGGDFTNDLMDKFLK